MSAAVLQGGEEPALSGSAKGFPAHPAPRVCTASSRRDFHKVRRAECDI
jgi:hypothetical protein